MKNTKRQAFTIVELVIVIAVIAILSAVLIPTFGSIIKNANIAADQTAASALTTELHVYLKGETIDSEEELMDALDKSGIGVKLVPKALAYGYHFWFDMKTQMIVANTAEEIAEMGKSENGENNETEPAEGAALTSATLTAETTKTYPKSMRNIYGNGYYIIDHNLIDAVCNLDEITKDNYAEYISNLEGTGENLSGDDYELYEVIAIEALKTLKSTVVVNNNGTFYHSENAGNANYYFTSGLKVISSDIYTEGGAATTLPAPKDGTLTLPGSVLLVEADALNFASETKINMASVEKTVDVFSPESTNAVIMIGEVAHIITNGTSPNNGADADILALNDGSKTFVADLVLKLPFEDFEVNFAKNDGDIYNDSTAGKLFVAYRNGNIQLNIIDPVTKEITDKVEKWTVVTEKSYGSFEIDPKTGEIDITTATVDSDNVCQVVVKATANTLSGRIDREMTVVVVMPVGAIVKVDTSTSNKIYCEDAQNSIGLTFTSDSDKASYDTTIEATYSKYYNASAVLSEAKTMLGAGFEPEITVEKLSTENCPFTYENGNMIYAVKDSDENVKDFETAKFNLSIDGYLTTEVTAEMFNQDNAIVETVFHHTYTDTRPYYIGQGEPIKLGDLFNATSNFGSATLNIYDSNDVVFGANENENYFSVNIGGESGKYQISGSDWASESLTFTFDESNPNKDHTIQHIWIEFVPRVNGTEVGSESTKIRRHFIVVKGAKNLTESEKDTITGDFKLDSNTVLHTDIKVNTGTTINVGDKTLYGNGYVIDATTYVGVPDETVDTLTVDEFIYCSICDDDSITDLKYSYYCTTCAKHVESTHANWCIQCVSEVTSCNKYNCTKCGATDVDKTHLINGKINPLDYRNWHDANDSDKHTVVNHAANGGVINHTENTKKQTAQKYYPADNYYLIKMDSGTIDNIYLNGPVYPKLQYEVTDYTDPENSSKIYAKTQYYVSGILATGNSVISNSYATGFRQPVQASGSSSTLKVDNTTLRGGNYANLLLSEGNLYIKNVTTIQDQGGQKATVEDTNKSVVGVGIALARGALSSTITIEGELNQFNWIKQDTTASLPNVTAPSGARLNLNTIFGYIFKGMVGVEIGSVQNFIHKDQQNVNPEASSAINNNYVNAGLVFCELGETDELNKLSIGVNIVHVDRKNGSMADTEFEHYTLQFSKQEKLNINPADILGTDGIFAIWSYHDGRQWIRPETVINLFGATIRIPHLNIDLIEGSEPSVILDSTTTETMSGAITDAEYQKIYGKDESFGGEYIPVVYRGYYANLYEGKTGVYSDYYKVNDFNKLVADPVDEAE